MFFYIKYFQHFDADLDGESSEVIKGINEYNNFTLHKMNSSRLMITGWVKIMMIMDLLYH